MKRCPNCRGLELYDDVESRCPHCGAPLIPYVRENGRGGAAGRAAGPISPNSGERRRTNPEDPVFESRDGRKTIYRGMVVSISPTSRFMTSPVKWFNAVFRGRPYQLGNPVHETVIRLEEICRSRIPEEMRALIFYGEPGEMDVGDDVTITAVQRHGRLEAQSIYIHDIKTDVRPQDQIPGGAVIALSVSVAVLVALFVSMVLSFFTSGGIWTVLNTLVGVTLGLAGRLIATLSPLLILLFVYWLFFRRR